MMKLVFDNLISNRIQELERNAADKIHVRGYMPDYDVPADFRKLDWFVPFNQIPIKYCPTDRYSYLHKYENDVKLQQTWERFTGTVLDKLYDCFIKKLHAYLNTTTLGTADILNHFQEFHRMVLGDFDSSLESKRPDIINFPEGETVYRFRKLLVMTLRYETQMASALFDYKVSMIKDLNIRSVPMLMFPFVAKPPYTVTSFGISNNAQPDFLYNNKIMIDVKSPPWNEEYLTTLGGYALIHEKANNKDMNLGMIVTPEFANKRNVPHFFNSEVVLIDDRCRKAFLLRRDSLLEQMKSAQDPGLPESDKRCKSCGYYKHCWAPV